jgi:putative hydrolase of the HAD superfamily
MLRYALFDLDDTLYASQTGLWSAIKQRINRYLIERMGFQADEAVRLREHYLHTFGTTLGGLRQEFKIDAEDYLNFVHDLPLADYLQPDPALNGMLARLPLTKVIFTNSDAAHVRRVLDHLGVTQRFVQIIDIYALDFLSKPDPRAYTRALNLIPAQPEECVFIEDSRRNLLPAQALGMLTVLVGNEAAPEAREGITYQIPEVLGLERVLAGVIGQKW